MKRSTATTFLKTHTAVLKLHDSRLVTQILRARKGTPEARPDLSLRAIFPDLQPPDIRLYLRPMLSDAQMALLVKTKAARESLGFTRAWADDRGSIWMKKDDNATPIRVHGKRTLDHLRSGSD